MSWGDANPRWSPPPGDEYHERWSRVARSADDFSFSRSKDEWRDRDSRHRRKPSRERDDRRDGRSREHSRNRNYERDRSSQGRDYNNDKYDDYNKHDKDRDHEKDTHNDDDRRSNNSRRRSPRRRSRSPLYSRSRGNRSRSRSPSRNTRDPSSHSRSHREESDVNAPAPGDWYCRCGALNFRRRSICYWRDCGAKREEAEVVTPRLNTTSGHSSVGMTRVLLLRPIGPKTTAEDILFSLSTNCPLVASSMSGVSLIRGGARLQFNTLSEASTALTGINSLNPPLQIGGHSVQVTYYSDKSVASELPAPVNPDYTAYYSTYSSETDRVNAAAAVAQSAISQLHAVRSQWVAPIIVQPVAAPVPPKGDGSQTYPVPNTASFMYDESSGFYYDATTGLYYDSNTQYFYNNQLGQYMYWDSTRNTYLLAPQTQKSSEDDNTDDSKSAGTDNKDDKKKNITKEDKVKVAKKIAKDMERWAKTLNQKKENARNGIVIEQQLQQAAASSGSADIGYKVLEKSESRTSALTIPHLVAPYSAPLLFKPDIPDVLDNIQKAYSADEDENIVDWQKLSCLLCKRQFNSADVLKKHVEMSNLHKENLARHRQESDSLEMDDHTSINYRDRAAERRLKFGEEDAPPFKPPPPPAPRTSYTAPPEPQPLDATSVGGRLLSKMGWSEGTGLGRSRSGRTSPVRAERRSNLAGLGQKRGVYQAAPGETYRDTVKKLAIARYQDLLQEEQGTK